MARLHIMNFDGERRVEVTLSRRNLLALLQKVDMPDSARQIENTDCFEDGVQTPLPPTTLVLRCEDDDEHYAKRELGPGIMHPDTEQFVQKHGGAPGEVLVIEQEPNDG
jgi:hypothetical protein